jgi:hypothetical protein
LQEKMLPKIHTIIIQNHSSGIFPLKINIKPSAIKFVVFCRLEYQ